MYNFIAPTKALYILLYILSGKHACAVQKYKQYWLLLKLLSMYRFYQSLVLSRISLRRFVINSSTGTAPIPPLP